VTAPLEFEELEAVPFSALVRTRCRQCGTPGVLAAPGRERDALCGPHLREEASLATAISRLPAEPPPPLGWDRPEWCGRPEAVSAAEVVPPEFVCPASGCDHEMPGPVGDLRDVAILAHWKVRVRHSRGGVMGGAGKQLAVADMWTVRFRRPGWAGYAARREDKWDSVCVMGSELPPFLALGVTDLKEWLADPAQPAEWYTRIRKRVADSALATKIVKCPGPGGCAWVDEARGLHTHRANGDIKIKTSKKEQVQGL
jgi:hypothetical protein